MVDKGWGILGQEEALGRPPELTGHLDLRAWHSDHGEAIIDLKTGAQIGAAWLQVGGYLRLYQQHYVSDRWSGYGVLHVPRTRIDRDVKGTLELRLHHPLAEAWDAKHGPHTGGNGRGVADAFAGAALRPLRGGLPGACWGCGMSGYTPSPWAPDGRSVWGDNRRVASIADCDTGHNVANADLIAAAPDLLAALIDMLFMHSVMSESQYAIARLARKPAPPSPKRRGKRHECYGSEPAHGSVGQRHRRCNGCHAGAGF